MPFTIRQIAPALVTGAAAALIAAPAAAAAPSEPCAVPQTSTSMCQSSGNEATPPDPAGGASHANDQNGAYGPSGNTPPVGGGR
ncbi:hypothetical protein ACTXG7_23995 [Mycolicibacterium sp. Dal123E01]|uniref:hypothetical protein n=1 Tax=Mycolicibacterium sp. Dal123E01 TaxID=3457578 RepID=UPI00403EE7D5